MARPIELVPLGFRGRSTNLPLQLTTFVGRQRELAEVTRLLAAARLLTLVGAGGVGKTRLALRVAEDLLESSPDGVWLVELASVADPAIVPHSVAGSLGVRETADQHVINLLVEHLELKQLVLILDNCEHVVQVCADLANHLLRACPHLRILATSRQPLGVAGEIAWRVPSLGVPDSRVASGTDEIGASEAVRLFCERAQLVSPGWVLDDHNAASVAAVCRSLDGIPLAIELAAARLNVLSIQQIADRLDDRFRVLVGSGRTVAPRHRTLGAVVEWSHDLLTMPERALFRRLAVFAGGWMLESAEAICLGEGLERGEILDVLARLVEQSLVLGEEERSGKRRYRLLETLRAYANDRLREAGEDARFRDRHLAWCVALAEDLAPQLSSPEQIARLRVLETEQDNLRGGLSWSLRSGQIELCLRLAVACGYFWEIRGHLYRAEGFGWLEKALSHPRAQDVPASVRAPALYWAGTYAGELFRFERATALLEASLSLWQQLGDGRGMAEALLSLGVAARVRGEYQRATAVLDQALGLMQERGDELGTAQVQRQRGRLARELGRVVEAEHHHSESLRIFQDLGELHEVGHVCAELGEIARLGGAWSGAAELYDRAAVLLGQAGCEEGISTTRYYLARLARDKGDAEQADILGLDALRLMREIGVQREIPACFEFLASLAAANDPRRAVCLLAAADSLRTAIGAVLPAVDRIDHERTFAVSRGRLSESAFAAAWRAGGAMTVDEAIASALLGATNPMSPITTRTWPELTARESEVAMLISRGLTNREIAAALVIAERTAEAHVTHVLTKLGLRSRTQIALWAAHHGTA